MWKWIAYKAPVIRLIVAILVVGSVVYVAQGTGPTNYCSSQETGWTSAVYRCVAGISEIRVTSTHHRTATVTASVDVAGWVVPVGENITNASINTPPVAVGPKKGLELSEAAIAEGWTSVPKSGELVLGNGNGLVYIYSTQPYLVTVVWAGV